MRTLISIAILTSIILSCMYVNSHSLNHFKRNEENLQNISTDIKDEKVFFYDGMKKAGYDIMRDMVNDFKANDYNKVTIVNTQNNSDHQLDNGINQIIADALKTLSNLTYFEFTNSNRKSIGQVFDALVDANNLEYFKFDTNDSDFNSLTDAESQSFLNAFKNKTNLKILNLSNFPIDSEILGKALVNKPNLINFTTTNYSFYIEHPTFFEALKLLTNLQYIDLQNLNLDKDTSTTFGRALGNMPNLTYLHLARGFSSDTIFTSFLWGIFNHNKIKHLSFEGYSFENSLPKSPTLGAWIRSQHNLTYLSLIPDKNSNLYISKEETDGIIDALEDKDDLRYINLNKLTIADQESSDNLSSNLASMKHLEELILTDFKFPEICFFKFYDMRNKYFLKKLSFVSSNLNVKSAEALSFAIQNFPNIAEINLFGNNIKMIGTALILRALDERTNIDYLNFKQNNILIDTPLLLASSVIKDSNLSRQYGYFSYELPLEKKFFRSKIELNCFQSDKIKENLNQGELDLY